MLVLFNSGDTMINNFNFKKKYGQNFLKDKNIVEKIIKSASLNEDVLVIEIGAGFGALTKELVKSCGKVLTYEIDDSVKEILEKELSNFNNVEIIYKDFLKVDLVKDLAKYNFKDIYVVANLPYYITTPIINKIIDSNVDIKKMLIMVQKEVADRFCAKVGSKNYNSLTVFLNYYYNIKKLFDVNKGSFIPSPKVDSSVVLFEKKEQKLKVLNEDIFFKLIKDSFVFKRKTLKNNLKGYNLDKIEDILKKYDMDLNVRAENVSLEIFLEIANMLSE